MNKLFSKLIRANAAARLALFTISLCIVGFTCAFAVALGLDFKVFSNAVFSQPGATVPQAHSRERVEAELITLTRNGFVPARIRRPQGPFILGVDNRSGIDGVALRLERVNGARLSALESRTRKLSWRDLVDLPPGEYVLAEANHPNWVCRISITPR